MKSLSHEKQAAITTSRYLDDLLNIDNIYFDQVVDRMYSTEPQLKKVNSSGTKATFLDLIYSYVYRMVQFPPTFMINGTILILNKVKFPFLDGDVPQPTLYGVYIYQLRLSRASSNLNDFNCRYKALTAKLLRQGYPLF